MIRCNGKKTQCTQLAWKCLSCSEIQEVYQPDGVLTEPYKCPTPHCRSKQFDVLISDPRTKAIDWQIIKIQEIRSGDEVIIAEVRLLNRKALGVQYQGPFMLSAIRASALWALPRCR